MIAHPSFRLIEPQDGPALEALIASTPDAGVIGFTNEYQADVVEIARAFASDLRGAVAEERARLIGMVFADITRVQWNHEERQAVYISNIRVHPDYRRQGVARQLVRWGLDYVEGLLGTGVMLYAAIVHGNVSLGLARQYGFVASEPVQGGIVPMRKRPPKSRSDLCVRLAEQVDLPAIADGMNRFYAGHNLWTPVTSSSLRAFLDKRVAGIAPNRLYAVLRGKRVVAGLSVSDRTRLVRMRISRLPALLRMLGTWLRILPASGTLRALTVRQVWFAEGELESGRYLWQQLRYRLRDQGNSMGIAYDPRSSLADLFQVPVWIPMFKARYLVRAEAADPARPTYCIAGP